MRYVDLGAVNAINQKNKAKKKQSSWKYLPLIPFFVVLVLLINFVRREGFSALLNPVSIVANFVNGTNLSSTDGRTNVLILGLDRRSYDKTGGLTDTMLVLSVGKDDSSIVMISLPRDLWVKAPSGTYSKINAVYAINGRDEAVEVVEDVLGFPIHYYAVVDFKAFEKVIDILGGIEVDVEKSFDDYYYPVEGMESAEPEELRYKHLHFDAGLQKMDSPTALEFSRSRKGSNDEGTDFARAKRQQRVIKAIWDKVASLETLGSPSKVKELYDTYKDYVETNVGLGEAQRLYEVGRSVGFNKIKSFVLDDRSTEDNGGLLYVPEDRSLYGGAYVLIPKAGDYSQIHAYIQKLLFGDK